MELLNPHLKKNAIPAYKKNYPLRFPAEKREYIDQNRAPILRACLYASRREVDYTSGKQIHVTDLSSRRKIFHKVAYGQSLAYIALKYKVSVANIRVWNRLRNNLIYPNQRLAIWVLDPTKSGGAPAIAKKAPKKHIKIEKIETKDTIKANIDAKKAFEK